MNRVRAESSESDVAVESLRVSAYRIPTDLPESDGTLAWDGTTLVLVELSAGGKTGLGYTYGHKAVATLIQDKLAGMVEGSDAMDIAGCRLALLKAIRNLGRPGICSMAIAAVDIALWDLKARLFDTPLATLLGACRQEVPIYGSGGFTSYSDQQLCNQLAGWVAEGIPRVKMKIGREPWRDLGRILAAREAIGPDAELFVDANGAFDRKQALSIALAFSELGVSWYEEPVSSDDLEGLRLIRDFVPPGVEVTAGEYGYSSGYFRRMLDAGAVDVLQADITRCAGLSGFLDAAALAGAYQLPLSAHCAPAAHLHACCAIRPLRHLEYFHGHVRIENLLFDGAPWPRSGALRPDLSRPGLGLEFRHEDAQRFRL
ncbi:MAG: mandelate racemase [Gammaproteobacteria bacterium]|nr:mandelate racemase [Gammaproteobacteria bacterium]